MALTATATKGFEPVRPTSGEEIFWLPGDPGVTYTKGDGVYLGATAGYDGLIAKLAGGAVQPVGRVEKTIVCPSNATAFPRPFEVFHIVADLPHGRYRNERSKQLLHWQPRDSLDIHWRRHQVGV